MSSLFIPAAANVSSAASMRRSSVPLFQCSPKGVQPMPTIATRSLMPWEAMRYLSSCFCRPLIAPSAPGRSGPGMPCEAMCRPLRGRPHGAGLPEVVVNVVGGEQLAEGHLDPVADLEALDVDVDQLDRVPAAAVEVDHR